MAFQNLRQTLVAWALVITAALPVTVSAEQSKDPETARIEKIIRNYLMENPEILVEVMQKLEARKNAQEEKDRIGVIRNNRDALFASAQDFIVKNSYPT